MVKEISDFNKSPRSERLHIGFFGRRNSGKSSLVNRITGQSLSLVSDVKGTTTDPVEKAMELLPLGPVEIIDTAGIDDDGDLGLMRVRKTQRVMDKTHVAVLVVAADVGLHQDDLDLIEKFKIKGIPFIVAVNKSDIKTSDDLRLHSLSCPVVVVSALTGEGIEELKAALIEVGTPLVSLREKKIIGNRLSSGDVVILVTPIDSSAPKGRMILPQVQVIRDLLDSGCCPLVTQVPQLKSCIDGLIKPPALVITDSQVFGKVNSIVDDSIPLTSFSILFAYYKGILKDAVSGAKALYNLKDGDHVLISEGCTHHRQCDDIGTVKLPRWIEDKSGKKLNFSFTSGGHFPDEELTDFALIVHCGGCMLNEKEVISRQKKAINAKVPFTNYGTLIAEINGILDKSLKILE